LDYFLPLENFGLVPRTLRGLTGILAMPFLHGDLKHLLGNTVPLAVTMMLLAGSRANSGGIVILITLLAGSGLWLFGREALHIGASGLVFGLIAFHVFAGIFEKRVQSVIIAIVVGLLYASTVVQGVVPFQRGVSWEGHLIGAVAGAIVALFTARMLKTASQSRQRSRK
jgi:membrane associated rhomboid family serine protease